MAMQAGLVREAGSVPIVLLQHKIPVPFAIIQLVRKLFGSYKSDLVTISELVG
jgi:hypothetical protein